MHRVVDKGEERFSVPFCFEPAYFSDLCSYARECNGEGDSNGGPILYGPWLSKKVMGKSFSDFPTVTFGDI